MHPRPAGKHLLDGRLSAAYELVQPCKLCADIGADHGKLSAALLGDGRAEHMLVTDISEKALAKARKLLAYARLSDRATFAVADGLDALDALRGKQADVVCIVGMGGDTIAGVLRRGENRLCGAALVLGAQTELPVLRQALCDIGYRLREERVAEAASRPYILMRATPSAENEPLYTEKELLLGPCLLRELPAGWEQVLRRKERLLETAIAAMEQAESQKKPDAMPTEQATSQRKSNRLPIAKQELVYIQETLAALRC